jgi:hypothetical protein
MKLMRNGYLVYFKTDRSEWGLTGFRGANGSCCRLAMV